MQVVILALIYGVKTFRVDYEGGDLLTICSLTVFQWSSVDPKTLKVHQDMSQIAQLYSVKKLTLVHGLIVESA